ncbi:MAG: hypothetical protein ACYSR0_00300 [Planctomycetota bacterium]|jgi:hypothetical protein
MASSETLVIFMPAANEPPSASQATFDTRNQHLILDYDASTSKVAVFSAILPSNYAGGGLDISAHTSYSTATAGSAVMNFYFERIGNEQADLDDAAGFAAAASMAIDVPLTSGSVNIKTINVTDGAAIDSIAVGDKFRLKVERDCNNATDDATGDLELSGVHLSET